VHAVQALLQHFDFALVSNLLALGVFEIFQHQLHVIQDVTEITDDDRHLVNGSLDGFDLRGLERRT
jgi:hypothetical protein